MLAAGLSLSRIAAPLGVPRTGGRRSPASSPAAGSSRSAATSFARCGSRRSMPGGSAGSTRAPSTIRPTASRSPSTGAAQDGRIGGVFVWQRLPDGRELALTGSSGPDRLRAGGAAASGSTSPPAAISPQRPNAPGGARSGRVPARWRFANRFGSRMRSWRRGWDQNELTLTELAAAARGRQRHPAAARSRPNITAGSRGRRRIPLIPFLVLPLAFATKRGRRGLGILVGGVGARRLPPRHELRPAARAGRRGGARAGDPRHDLAGALRSSS